MAAGLNRPNLTVVTTTVWLLHLSSASFKSINYQVQMDGNGSSLCSTDLPTTVFPMEISDSLTQCATKCNGQSCCMFFQLKSTQTQCELYDHVPSNLQQIEKCTGYKVLSLPNCPSTAGWYTYCTSCYFVNSGTTSFSVAQATCAAVKAKVLTIESEAKQDTVFMFMTSTTSFLGSASLCRYPTGVWISAQRLNESDATTPFVWKPTTSEIDDMNYTNWQNGTWKAPIPIRSPLLSAGPCAVYYLLARTWMSRTCVRATTLNPSNMYSIQPSCVICEK